MTDQAKRQAEQVTGVSNLTYDVMTVPTDKLQGIAAIEGDKRDATGDQEVVSLFDEIQRRDRQDVERPRDLVARRLR